MNLLTTQHFNTLVEYYNLQHFINYYKLFNKSKYINSYHGFEHVKRIICSIHHIFLNLNNESLDLSYDNMRKMMIAGIFHDFNYVGVDFSNPEYDKINIEETLKAVDNYYVNHFDETEYRASISFPIQDIKKFIEDTEYPACKEKKLDWCSKIFVECDHSMVIYEDYPIMGALFSVNECNILDKNQIIKCAEDYLNNVYFETECFQLIWENNSKKILESFKSFIISANIEELKNSKKSIYPNFEYIIPNF